MIGSVDHLLLEQDDYHPKIFCLEMLCGCAAMLVLPVWIAEEQFGSTLSFCEQRSMPLVFL